MHYGDKYTEEEYNNIMIKSCNDSGIASFIGDREYGVKSYISNINQLDAELEDAMTNVWSSYFEKISRNILRF